MWLPQLRSAVSLSEWRSYIRLINRNSRVIEVSVLVLKVDIADEWATNIAVVPILWQLKWGVYRPPSVLGQQLFSDLLERHGRETAMCAGFRLVVAVSSSKRCGPICCEFRRLSLPPEQPNDFRVTLNHAVDKMLMFYITQVNYVRQG